MGKRKIFILAVTLFAIIGLGTFVFAGSSDPEYSVVFNSNGGSKVDSQIVESGDKIVRPKNPTRENYEFAGWYLNLSDETEYDFAKRVFGDMILVAKWKEVEVVVPTTPEGNEPNEVVTPTEDERPNTQEPSTPNRPTTPTEPVTPTENPDKTRLNNALSSMNAKTITSTGTSLDYSFDGCVITNTSNSTSNSGTKVNGTTVTALYRGTSNGSITSSYSVKCGSETGTKTVNHVVSASPYTYTSEYTSMIDVYILRVSGGASNYTINVNGTPARYLSSANGAQIGGTEHTKGSTYNMTFNSDANTVYAVRSAEN